MILIVPHAQTREAAPSPTLCTVGIWPYEQWCRSLLRNYVKAILCTSAVLCLHLQAACNDMLRGVLVTDKNCLALYAGPEISCTLCYTQIELPRIRSHFGRHFFSWLPLNCIIILLARWLDTEKTKKPLGEVDPRQRAPQLAGLSKPTKHKSLLYSLCTCSHLSYSWTRGNN